MPSAATEEMSLGAREEMSSVAAEEMSSVATEEMSSVANCEMFSAATEDVSSVAAAAISCGQQKTPLLLHAEKSVLLQHRGKKIGWRRGLLLMVDLWEIPMELGGVLSLQPPHFISNLAFQIQSTALHVR